MNPRHRLITVLRDGQTKHGWPRVAARHGRNLKGGWLPETSHYPKGTTAEALLYTLGDPSRQPLRSYAQLSPANLRSLRQVAHGGNKHHPIHVFGILDNDSPFGTRRAFEAVVRFFQSAGYNVALHAGFWHPTPSEYRLGLAEIATLAKDGSELVSLFPIQSISSSGQTDYLDSLSDLNRNCTNLFDMSSLPSRPIFFSRLPLMADDPVFFANHQLDGLSDLRARLIKRSDSKVFGLDFESIVPQSTADMLNSFGYVPSLTNDRNYSNAYWGQTLNHPYAEELYVESPTELLELLLSPHFSHTTTPAFCLVLLALTNAQQAQADYYLAHYLQHLQPEPFEWYIVTPFSHQSVYRLSNQTV